MDAYKFANDPVARPESIVQGPNYRFTLLTPYVLRYEWSADNTFEDRPSTFAVNRNFPTPEHQVIDSPERLEIRAENYHVSYDKKRFSTSGLTASFPAKTNHWGLDWRYGVAVKHNLGGTARTLDEVDGRCDMGEGVLARTGHSALDDSESMVFTADGFVAPRDKGDRIDGYLFAYGFDFKGAMKQFYAISGKQPLIPRWALGNWWSRYHAYSAKEYLGLMDKFREHDIPMSVAVIDMDWHHVAGDHVPHAGWTGYSWNKELFPDPKGFCDSLHRRNLKTTLNDHPHAGIHSHEDLYDELAKALDHDTSKKAPILFDPATPKFMHAYLNVLHRRLEEEGCDFWWIDWQQGPHSRVPGLDPLWLLNHFHFLDHKNHPTEGSRPIIFSRYGGPGSHRYPVGFSGDTIVTWESLQFQPEFTATASNIGYGWWSHDIGGHMHGYRDDELETRWYQLGVFSPLMRLHSTHNRWGSKEPWRYRKEHEEAMTSIMQFRHRLVPYLHSMNERAANEDEPIVQPLYWKYPERDEAYTHKNEFFFGTGLLVAPIVHPRNKITNHAGVEAWITPGKHVDIFTGVVYDGDRTLRMYRPLGSIPVLAPEGALIPLDGDKAPKNGCPNPSFLEVLVVPGKDGKFTVYEDGADDEGHTAEGSRRIELEYKHTEGRFDISKSNKSWTLRLLGVSAVPSSITVSRDGTETKDFRSRVDKSGATALVIDIPNATGGDSSVSVTLGQEVQLEVVNHDSHVESLLLDFQIDFKTKDRILEICLSKHANAVKVGQVMALGLDEEVAGPILELLMADSRVS